MLLTQLYFPAAAQSLFAWYPDDRYYIQTMPRAAALLPFQSKRRRRSQLMQLSWNHPSSVEQVKRKLPSPPHRPIVS